MATSPSRPALRISTRFRCSEPRRSRAGERQAKSIFLHHYMDPHDFDLERLRKCCHHYAQADGRIMPACGFNLFHRGAAKGPGTAVPSWAKNAPLGSGTASARLRVLT